MLPLLPLAGLLTLTTAIETHGGVDFEVFWDTPTKDNAETKEIKTFYETESAKIAAPRLHQRMKDQDRFLECLDDEANTGDDLESFINLKKCIAEKDERAFFELFAEDIEKSNEHWEKVVRESTKPRKEWIASRSIVRCYYEGELTASQFAAWSASSDADAIYLDGNAEHYFKTGSATSPISQESSIFEGWGGVLSEKFGTFLTNFTVPDFRPRVFGVEPGYPAEWAINPLYGLLQRAGEKTLISGTVWGVLHIGVRDITALESSNGKSGIEIYGAIWYPPWDQSSEENQKEFKEKFLLDEDYQIAAEVVNFSLRAREYCKENTCSPLIPEGAEAELKKLAAAESKEESD